MKHRPKRDAWAVWLFALGLLVSLVVGVVLAMLDLSAGVVVAVLLVSVLGGVFFFSTYEVTKSHVVVRVGPCRAWRIRLDEVVEAAPVSSISATAHFAWSSDAIRIVCQRKIFGFLAPSVSISPRDRSEFLKELAAASPDLVLCNDGVVHRRNEPADAAYERS